MTDLGMKHKPGQLPPVGTKLPAKHKGKTYEAVIVHDKEAGRSMVKLGSKLFRSLSMAAASVTGHAMNGWQWFGLKPIVRPAPATPAPRRPKAKAKKTARRSKTAKPAAKQVPMVEGALAEVLLPTFQQQRAAAARAKKSAAQRARRAAKKAAS